MYRSLPNTSLRFSRSNSSYRARSSANKGIFLICVLLCLLILISVREIYYSSQLAHKKNKNSNKYQNNNLINMKNEQNKFLPPITNNNINLHPKNDISSNDILYTNSNDNINTTSTTTTSTTTSPTLSPSSTYITQHIPIINLTQPTVSTKDELKAFRTHMIENKNIGQTNIKPITDFEKPYMDLEYKVNEQLSKDTIEKLYNSNLVSISDLETDYFDIRWDLRKFTKLTREEQCDAYEIPNKHYFDNYINEEKVEFIFPENDKELYNLFAKHQFMEQFSEELDDYWYEFLDELDSDSNSDNLTPKERYNPQLNKNNRNLLDTSFGYNKINKYNHPDYELYKLDESQSLKELEEYNLINKYNNNITYSRKLLDKNNWKYFYDINGLNSDRYYFGNKRKSTGKNKEYWRVSDACVQKKGCTIHSNLRVLHNAGPISCKQIREELMQPIFDCVKKSGVNKCKLIIDSGYFRIVFKSYLKDGTPVVLKMMKPGSIGKTRDLLRHLRESVLLNYLRMLEKEYISKFGSKFKSTNDEERAFYYVPELGHCLYPTFISVSPYYKMNLDQYIYRGESENATVEYIMDKIIEIVSGVDTIHTIPGGPYHHTDIQPRQFMLDSNGHILINDFNRGKFQLTYFKEDFKDDLKHFNDTKTNVRCWYCGHRSRGHWRAPEEHAKAPLDSKLDIFSTGLIIWSLFSYTTPFADASFKDVAHFYWDQWMRPPMPSNIPPMLKDVIRTTLLQDPRRRPTSKELLFMVKQVKKNLKTITGNRLHYTTRQVRDKRIWRETNYPVVDLDK